MRFLRGLLGALLWLLAAVLGLVGIILCVTIILLPLGIPVLMLARRLLGRAVRLMLPRAVAHPVDELKKSSTRHGRKASKRASKNASALVGSGKTAAGRAQRRG